MEDHTGLISFVLTAVFSGIGVILKTLYKRITDAADKCESDRIKLWAKVNELEDRMKDCPQKDCPIRTPLSAMPAAGFSVRRNNRKKP